MTSPSQESTVEIIVEEKRLLKYVKPLIDIYQTELMTINR